MILLDTNVISEVYRPVPDPSVIRWINAQPRVSMYLCTPVLAEMRFGVARLPEGSRKARLQATIERLEIELFRGRILTFDVAAASEYGRLAALRQRAGKPIDSMDILIAAIAAVHGATLVTRNMRDFDELGIEIINPFELPAAH